MTRALPNLDLEQIKASKIWIMLAVFTLVLMWGGYQLGDRFGLLLGFFAALALNVLVFTYTEWRLGGFFPGNEIEGHDPWGLLRVTRELSHTIGIRRPRLFVSDTKTPFAYSVGLLASGTKVVISTGLIERLSPDEVRAVLAYEVERIKFEHTRSVTAASALAGLLVLFAGALDSALFLKFWKRGLERWSMGPLTLLVSPIVAIIMRIAVNRHQVLSLDLATAEVVGDKLMYARTLYKLDAYNKALPLDVSVAEAPLFIVDPLFRVPLARKLSAQPSIEARVRNLVGRYPV